MKRTDKTTWLLALDGSPDAEGAAQYVARVAKMQGVGEIHVLNVQPMDGLRAGALRRAEVERHAGETAMGITTPARTILESAGLVVHLHSPRQRPCGHDRGGGAEAARTRDCDGNAGHERRR